MITADELAGMRETSESAMPDTVLIQRPPAPGTTIYNGRGRLRSPGATQIEVVFGDAQTTRERFILTVPHNAGDIKIGDIATVPDGTAPQIGPRAFRVVAVQGGSHLIDRRIGVEVITS